MALSLGTRTMRPAAGTQSRNSTKRVVPRKDACTRSPASGFRNVSAQARTVSLAFLRLAVTASVWLPDALRLT